MERETEVAKELDVLHLSGLNESVEPVRVERHQFATLQSLFPYEVGHLRRLTGKVTEYQVAFSVRSIHQMHTPYGQTMRFVQRTDGVYYDTFTPAPMGSL